ncbi:MAG: hypothetical protein ACI84C_002902, partial [Flavobacteriales bacterium]
QKCSGPLSKCTVDGVFFQGEFVKKKCPNLQAGAIF